MSQKIIQFVVVFLAFLIFLCFIALIYGLYINTGKKQINIKTNNIIYNLKLQEGHNITDIDLVDDNRILFTIKNDDKVYGIIYDIKNADIIKIDNANE